VLKQLNLKALKLLTVQIQNERAFVYFTTLHRTATLKR